MNNLAYGNPTDLEVSTVSESLEQANPPGGSTIQKRSIRTFIKRLRCRHLFTACLIIAFVVVVIGISVYFAKKSSIEESSTEEDVSCLPSAPGVKLDYSQGANFVAYVVLIWPWSSAMNNSNSQVYEESIIKADYWVKKIFQSSSRSSCIKSVAKDMVTLGMGTCARGRGGRKLGTSINVVYMLDVNDQSDEISSTRQRRRFGGNILLLVHLDVTCETMTKSDVEKAYEEGYSLLLTTQNKSCVSNIKPNISVQTVGEDKITAPAPIPSTICGQSQLYPAPRIVGGQPVHRGQYPWVVILLEDGEFLCGGTIWDYDHILTAAHCIDKFLMNILTGEVNTSVMEIIAGKWEYDVDTKSPGEQRVPVASGLMHTNYEIRATGTLVNDIALLRLSQSLVPTQLVMKVCHPTADATLPEQAIVAGWGETKDISSRYPDSLLGVQLTLLDYYTCAKLRSFTYSSSDDIPIGTMCGIGNELTDKDSCQGDSGGPIFWNLGTAVDQRYTIIGVVSYGEDCGDLGSPGVYASVQFYLDWIKDTINVL